MYRTPLVENMEDFQGIIFDEEKIQAFLDYRVNSKLRNEHFDSNDSEFPSLYGLELEEKAFNSFKLFSQLFEGSKQKADEIYWGYWECILIIEDMAGLFKPQLGKVK
jgi:hypothetical protein